jgi:hypothetical protein
LRTTSTYYPTKEEGIAVELVKEIPTRENLFVAFVNGPESLHGARVSRLNLARPRLAYQVHLRPVRDPREDIDRRLDRLTDPAARRRWQRYVDTRAKKARKRAKKEKAGPSAPVGRLTSDGSARSRGGGPARLAAGGSAPTSKLKRSGGLDRPPLRLPPPQEHYGSAAPRFLAAAPPSPPRGCRVSRGGQPGRFPIPNVWRTASGFCKRLRPNTRGLAASTFGMARTEREMKGVDAPERPPPPATNRQEPLPLQISLHRRNVPAGVKHGVIEGGRGERKMGKKRLCVIAVCAAAFMGVGANAALAGEVNGNGDNTPIGAAPDNDPHASSECSFSGLNDEYYRDGDTSQPRTQHPAPGNLHGGDNACRGN